MEVSLCIVTCSVFSRLAQRRIYGMSRNLNCTMIVLQFFVLLTVQNGVKKDMFCLRVLLYAWAEGNKILQLSQRSKMVYLFSFMM
jgi:hypothetical protein